MISKNLTPFFWGPKATSRQPPQVEMAVCVRGVFWLRPGEPLTPIEDEIEQGFMSGHQWAEQDLDRRGPVTCPDDFAEWKPNAEVLLKGTAHPPGGQDIACDVAFGVGDWAKSLRVFGPRVYKPGVLFGGAVRDPAPFSQVPLTWENAYGGPAHPWNVVGKGFHNPELPLVEAPGLPLTEPGQSVPPASFLPLSPLWPQRSGKIGSNYGAGWEATRAPFYADDFDWSYFNCAAADQQLAGYLRGDETVWFQNLHPEAPRFEVPLPGLRLRAVVRRADETLWDLTFVLDTLFADLDAGKLYLTWRAHTPVGELDLTDVVAVLLASEPLTSEPLPAEHYQQLLQAFEEDPVGLKDAFPPGVLEVGQAMLAARKAELEGTPPPDFKQLAETLPATGLIPPWAVAAYGELRSNPLAAAALVAQGQGQPNPLEGIDLASLRALKGTKDPAVVAAQLEELATTSPDGTAASLKHAAERLRALPPPGAAPAPVPADALAQLAPALPGPQRAALEQAAGALRRALTQVSGAAPAAAAVAAGSPLSARLEALSTEVGEGAPPPPDVNAQLEAALAPLDAITLPAVAPFPDVCGQHLALLEQQEASWRARVGDHPLLGLFALGKRLTASAGQQLTKVRQPDPSAVVAGFERTEQELLALGASAATIAPLVGLKERLRELFRQLPGRPPPPSRDFAHQDLQGADFAGKSLRGKSFAGARLQGARFVGSDLQDADFRDADLTEADLSGANLTSARFSGATLLSARLRGAALRRARCDGADLTSADLHECGLEGADLSSALLSTANLGDADLSGANLAGALLPGANLARANLTNANLEQAQLANALLPGANLTNANLQMANLAQADLRQAVLVGANLGLAVASAVRADGIDLSGAQLDMACFDGSRLVDGRLKGVRSTLGSFVECDLTNADFGAAHLEQVNLSASKMDRTSFAAARCERLDLRDVQATDCDFLGATLTRSSTGGAATFTRCRFQEVHAERTVWLGARLETCDFAHAQLPDALFQMITGEDLSFFAANLQNSSFRKATLHRSSFVNTDLCHADLSESRLTEVLFSRANLYDAKFVAATLLDSNFLETARDHAWFQRAEGVPE